MIAVLSSKAGERAILRSLFEGRDWPCADCATIRDLMRLVSRVAPQVIVVRQTLTDGYSDEVITRVSSVGRNSTRIIVLAAPSLSPALEARQLALGADTVLRDPVRTEVLVAYVSKYRARPTSPALMPPGALGRQFCLAELDPTEWSVTYNRQTIRISPREMSLAELLSESEGAVVSYDRLYSTIMDRTFAGDSGNMRVLFALLQSSMETLGIRLRDHVTVIPKSGYRYTHAPHAAEPATRGRRPK